MFGKNLALFSQAIKRLPKAGVSRTRSLYTDSIYPYPFNYINNTLHPSQALYRENFITPRWVPGQHAGNKWGFRAFWFYFFMSLFNDPGVLIGHHTFPDPSLWTDEELGIPPEDAGSYKDWLASKQTSES